MEQSELLVHLCQHLEQVGVRYLITGSQATIAYGEPRFTVDIDVVVELKASQLDSFCDGFPSEEFYLSRQAALDAIVHCGMFNVIHPASGLKIDVVISKGTEFDKLRMSRGRRIPISDSCEAVFVSPEDIILKKLQWHRMGGGERHLRDIAGVVRIQGNSLDFGYIVQQAQKLQVVDLWLKIQAAEPGE